MKQNQLNTFFYYLSCIVIIIPFVIVGLAIIIKTTPSSSENTAFLSEKISPTKTPIKISSDEAKLDLKGPWTCLSSLTPTPKQWFNLNQEKKDESPLMKAYIKDRNIFIEREDKEKTKWFLLKEDCLYIWEKNNYYGEKICGLSPYVSMVENLSQFNLFSYNSLMASLSNFGDLSGFSTDSAQLENFFKSCKKEEILDMMIFNLPKKVLFRNK